MAWSLQARCSSKGSPYRNLIFRLNLWFRFCYYPHLRKCEKLRGQVNFIEGIPSPPPLLSQRAMMRTWAVASELLATPFLFLLPSLLHIASGELLNLCRVQFYLEIKSVLPAKFSHGLPSPALTLDLPSVSSVSQSLPLQLRCFAWICASLNCSFSCELTCTIS